MCWGFNASLWKPSASRFVNSGTSSGSHALEFTREMLKEPLRVLFERVDARLRDLVHQRIAELAMAEAFADLKEGDLITEEHVRRLSSRVADLHMGLTRRVPIRRSIDAGRILRPEPEQS